MRKLKKIFKCKRGSLRIEKFIWVLIVGIIAGIFLPILLKKCGS